MEQKTVPDSTVSRSSRFAVRRHRCLNLVKKYLWILLLTIGSGVGIQAWRLHETPQRYVSNGEMMVTGGPGVQGASSSGANAAVYFATQIKLIEGRTILDRVRQRMSQKSPGVSGQVEVEVIQTPGTTILTLCGTGTDLDYTQQFLQTVMEEFKLYKLELVDLTMTGVGEEMLRLSRDIKVQEEELLKFEQEGNSTDAHGQLATALANARFRYEKMINNSLPVDEVGNSRRENIHITLEATPPQIVVSQRKRELILGLLAGMGVGAFLLMLLYCTDDRIASFSELNERLGLPVLGQIPTLQVLDKKGDSFIPLLVPDDKRFVFSEAFRNLRSSLIFMPAQAEMHTLLITSSVPGEGKSTIAANLAITMALAGARVLLVDADFKLGDLAKIFSVDGRLGFSNVLRGEANWRKIQQSTAYENLTLLPRGPAISRAGEFLLQPVLDTFMKEAKAAYDLVIFNSAPVLATDDTTTLAPNVDACLMVVRSFATSFRQADHSLVALRQRQANVLGLILNDVEEGSPGFKHYGYKQYHTNA